MIFQDMENAAYTAHRELAKPIMFLLTRQDTVRWQKEKLGAIGQLGSLAAFPTAITGEARSSLVCSHNARVWLDDPSEIDEYWGLP